MRVILNLIVTVSIYYKVSQCKEFERFFLVFYKRECFYKDIIIYLNISHFSHISCTDSGSFSLPKGQVRQTVTKKELIVRDLV